MIAVREIQRRVMQHYGIPAHAMLERQRGYSGYGPPRQLAMFLARNLTNQSYLQIGRRFGITDHTSVIWAIRKAEREIERDPDLLSDIRAITAELEGVDPA